MFNSIYNINKILKNEFMALSCEDAFVQIYKSVLANCKYIYTWGDDKENCQINLFQEAYDRYDEKLNKNLQYNDIIDNVTKFIITYYFGSELELQQNFTITKIKSF